MSETKNYQNKEWLSEQYITLERKVVDIAKECGVNVITIGRWRKKFGITSRKFSEKAINKMSEERRGKNINEENHNWKGNDVSYKCLHDWVRKRKSQPERCENCGNKKEYLELANISGEYKRDIKDYRYLCVRCHKEFDGTLQSFVEGGKKTRFKKGEKSWNSGLIGVFKHTEETKQKISQSLKGKRFTEDHKKNLSKALKGKNTRKTEILKKTREQIEVMAD